MKEKIKASQFGTLAFGYILGSILLLSMLNGNTLQDTWMVILSGLAVSLPFMISFAYLARRFPGKSLFEIHRIVYGKVAGWIVSFVFLLYFWLLLAFNVSDLASFYKGYIMTETPKIVFILCFVLVAAFAVKRGIAAIAKVSLLTMIFHVFAVAAITLLLIGEMDFSNLLPLFKQPAVQYIKTTHTMATLPYLEIISLLMVTPLLDDYKKLGRSFVKSAAFAAVIFVVITLRDVAVLGPSIRIYTDDSFESVRMIDIGEFLTRIELLIALAYTGSLFIKISVLYFSTTSGIAQLTGVKDYGPLIVPIGTITIVMASIVFPSTTLFADWGNKYAPVFSTLCTMILPIITLIVAKARGLKIAPPPSAPEPAQQ